MYNVNIHDILRENFLNAFDERSDVRTIGICQSTLFYLWIVYSGQLYIVERNSVLGTVFPLGTNGTEAIMRVLNVAEKNDAAKNIAALLSKGTAKMRQGYSKYNKIYEFDCNISGNPCNMIMTSVSGHLLNFDFSSLSRNWTSCNPVFLFQAPIIKSCPKEYDDIKKTLEREVKSCSKLIIWTDCDREGENIGFEIIEICTNIKPRIEIFRAKFSEITFASVYRALCNLGKPNENVNTAVNVRRELDLRIGAAFTRFQTLHLKGAFPEALGNSLISYGSCQFPTLGFVVERFKAIANFIPEKFWKIIVLHIKDNISVEFVWERSRLFNKLACEVLYDICREHEIAKVLTVETKPKTKWRPRPLDTVELEKLASRKLRITAKETMKIAEKLYTLGFISYPRTETNIFPKEMNLLPLVQNFVQDSIYGDFANTVLQNGPNPFQGIKSDKAHPPIHPIKYTNQLNGNEQRIYDFIVRHFLACLSKHAEGLETIVKIDIAEEKFTAKGLVIVARNYLDIYPFDKWSDKEMHKYEEGEEFRPDIKMNEGETSPPPLLTEADLIALMEKHGIGTDATHAEHIETIKARMYVGLSDKYFIPRTLGMGLVEGYDSMGFHMSKPHLRAELENDLNRICEGNLQGNEVLAIHLEKYKQIFISAQHQVQKLNKAIEKYLKVQAEQSTIAEVVDHIEIEKVKSCQKCGFDMVLRTRKTNESNYLNCTNFPRCREAIFFPTFVKNVSVTSDTCQTCRPEVFLLKFKFHKGSCFLPSSYIGCIGGCDACLNSVLIRNDELNENKESQVNNCENGTTISKQKSFIVSDSNVFSRLQTLNKKITSENQTLINCNCGKMAIRLTVKKPGPNCGKQFYKCGSDRISQGCDFFKWVDNKNVNDTVPISQNFNNREDSRRRNNIENDNVNHLNCFCGLLSKRCEVLKDGANKGRKFFSCSKSMADTSRCSYFKWDEASNSNNKNIECSTFRSQEFKGLTHVERKGNQLKKRKCGLCGQEGHNRKNCPQGNKHSVE